MRCGCPGCGAFMVQAEDAPIVCVCPDCGYRCDACLGTGTALTRDDLLKLRGTEWFTPSFSGGTEENGAEESYTK
jgi:hypothetical protein